MPLGAAKAALLGAAGGVSTPTMEPIGQFVADGTTTVVSFTSVPQTYRSLRIVLAAGIRATAASAFGLNFNSDSTTGNYGWIQMANGGTASGVESSENSSSFYIGGGSDEVPLAALDGSSFWLADIENYSDASLGTAVQIKYGVMQAGGYYSGMQGLSFDQASAVTQIDCVSSSTTSNYYMNAPTVITLFGIGSS